MGVRTAARELLLVLTFFGLYKAVRLLGSDTSQVALANAVWLPSELALQQLVLGSEPLVRFANAYYAAVHFPLTVGFLGWLFVRHEDRYRAFRSRLAVLTGLAMLVHLAFPLAPPRMLGGAGFVDTAAAYGPTVYGNPGADSVSNQFAAMPSLHSDGRSSSRPASSASCARGGAGCG